MACPLYTYADTYIVQAGLNTIRNKPVEVLDCASLLLKQKLCTIRHRQVEIRLKRDEKNVQRVKASSAEARAAQLSVSTDLESAIILQQKTQMIV